jgi:hypothetical protein
MARAFKMETISPFNPGFYKLFDELLVNAHDHAGATEAEEF